MRLKSSTRKSGQHWQVVDTDMLSRMLSLSSHGKALPLGIMI